MSKLESSAKALVGKSSCSRSDKSKIDGWTSFLHFYNTHLYTDVILKVDDHRFPCHRLVLAAGSEYFDKLFSCDLKEKDSPEVELRGTDAETLSVLLDFLYSANIHITAHNVNRLVQAADQFLLSEVTENCENFMISENCLANCLNFYRLARLYRLEQLEKAALKTMRMNFYKIIKSKDFRVLSAEELIGYISDADLEVETEDDVFKAVEEWVYVNPEVRSADFPKLAEHIRFPYLTKDFLSDEVHMHPLMFNKECQKYVNEALAFHMLPDEDQLSTPRTQPRCADSRRECLVLIGGHDNGVVNNDVFSLKPDGRTWKVVTRLPPELKKKRYYRAVSVHRGIILTGGYHKSNWFKESWLFDIKRRKWKALADMITARFNHCGEVINEHVYIIGGDGRGELKSVEMYNQVTNQWTPLPDMPKALTGMLTVSYENSIYVFGGFGGKMWTKVTFAYNTEENTWEQLWDMPVGGYPVGGRLVNDKVYVLVVGNVFINYDLLLNTWTRLSHPIRGHDFGAAVIWKGKVFVSGGEVFHNNTFAEEYDPEEDVWTDCKALQLPKPLQLHQMLVVYT